MKNLISKIKDDLIIIGVLWGVPTTGMSIFIITLHLLG